MITTLVNNTIPAMIIIIFSMTHPEKNKFVQGHRNTCLVVKTKEIR